LLKQVGDTKLALVQKTWFRFLSSSLGHWVKPRFITWFSQLFMIEYDDERWIENFQMSKSTLLQIDEIPSKIPSIEMPFPWKFGKHVPFL
jgi:hypothetical protein